MFFAGFLLGLLFDLEDGRNIFLRNVGLFPNYTELNPVTTVRTSNQLQKLLSDAGEETCLAVFGEKTKYLFIFLDRNARAESQNQYCY
jgi:hypothetical protein